MESRYTRKLYEKEDIILTLNDQIDYLISNKHHAEDGDTESFVSTIDYSDEDVDNSSSIYDRDVEQGLTVVENRPSTELKSENILDNIQVTMRAIEQELNSHATNDSKETIVTDSGAHTRRHRRSPPYNSANTYFSSATLIESELGNNKKKIKKQGFSINRIFKKAFPKLYKKHNNINTINTTTMNLKYSKSLPTSQVRRNYHIDSALFENDSSLPRSSTDETLGVYSTTSSSDFRKPVNVMDLLPAMNNNVVLV
ncbi:hypothetical protein INT48_003772 [Thamnidium elegans]|uniref:Uncharacterized protein n=1 Tax=Thamnidium elegans TaxID=101142 RepID=A0A8H7W164_9FUNG|nr:hypothetical protein INT48_003772 [Thamnidium elegans]